MGQKITQVDAFTDKPFAGNPAAVCILEAPRDGNWMCNVAREMNLSETAFLVRQADSYDLRWFTPTVEIALCGHATLASAHVLWEEGHLKPAEQARFHTKSGLLTADRRGEWIELDFPAVIEEPVSAPDGLAEALGAKPCYVGKNKFDYLAELESEDAVRRLAPNHSALRAIGARGIIGPPAQRPAASILSHAFSRPAQEWTKISPPAPRIAASRLIGRRNLAKPGW